MKPLTHWAIHHQQKMRIAGRDPAAVWGVLVAANGTTQPFRYELQTQRLALGDSAARRILQLDAYGFEQDVPTADT
ncbi:MAG: hypothetical protein WAZ19_15715 [Anaerolineae bacterium]